MALQVTDVVEAEPPAVVAETPKPPVIHFITPHRVTVVDLDEIGMWLIGRLKEKYPRQDDRRLLSWLRGCTNDNDCLFLRAGGGVAMATLHKTFLRRPWVEEVFCLAMEDCREDKLRAQCLYTNIREWAISHGAETMIVLEHSDVFPLKVEAEIGELRSLSRRQHRLLDAE